MIDFPIRVLVVDDQPRALRLLRQLLEAYDYEVTTADSRDTALELLMQKRFHVAVLDLRLNEADSDDYQGLELMRAVDQIDPTTAVIIMTGYGNARTTRQALQAARRESPFRLWRSLAFDHLEKDDSELRRLPEYIEQAFNEVLGINRALKITYPPEFLRLAADRMITLGGVVGAAEDIQAEIDELLRKLFSGWNEIRVEPMTGSYTGHGKAMVFRVLPRGQLGHGEVIIAKIGDHAIIEREITRYRMYVRGMAGGNFVPTALEPAWRTRSLGGVVYTYAGLGGQIHDFAELYPTLDAARLGGLVETLFSSALRWQATPTEGRANAAMWDVFAPLLRLREDELRASLEPLTSGDSPFRRHGDKLRLGEQIDLPDPVAFVLNQALYADYRETIIHGDLHIHNVLIDHQRNVWLIDFATTEPGPAWLDQAFFETSIRLEMTAAHDWQQSFAFVRALLTAPDFFAPSLPPELEAFDDFVKAHAVIVQVRATAARHGAQAYRRAYVCALLFTALRLMTVKFLQPARYQQALMAAAVAADLLAGDS